MAGKAFNWAVGLLVMVVGAWLIAEALEQPAYEVHVSGAQSGPDGIRIFADSCYDPMLSNVDRQVEGRIEVTVRRTKEVGDVTTLAACSFDLLIPDTAGVSRTVIFDTTSQQEFHVGALPTMEPVVTVPPRPGDQFSQATCEEASCFARGSIVFRGDLYSISCIAVSPEQVSNRVIGTGLIDGVEQELNPVDGLNIAETLAINRSAECSDGIDPSPSTGWTFVLSAERGLELDAICEAAVFSGTGRAGICEPS